MVMAKVVPVTAARTSPARCSSRFVSSRSISQAGASKVVHEPFPLSGLYGLHRLLDIPVSAHIDDSLQLEIASPAMRVLAWPIRFC